MAKFKNESRTMQLWPSGQSIEFQGDIWGPPEQRRLREGHYQDKVHCPVSCRKFHIDYLSDEDRAKYIAAVTAAKTKKAAMAVFPKLGKYIRPLAESEGPDWTQGPICETCKGEGFIPNPKGGNPWREGTPEEWRKVRVCVLAERYAENEILAVQSSLIDDLMKHANDGSDDIHEAFQYDELTNLYPDPDDWDADDCREWLDDHGHDQPDRPMVSCAECKGLGEIQPDADADNPEPEALDCVHCKGTGEVADPDADENDDYLDELRQAVRDNGEAAEVYEWWLISRWLCDELKSIGEVVLDNGYGRWWGRTCSGQQLIMDGTLQKVAANHVKESE